MSTAACNRCHDFQYDAWITVRSHTCAAVTVISADWESLQECVATEAAEKTMFLIDGAKQLCQVATWRACVSML